MTPLPCSAAGRTSEPSLRARKRRAVARRADSLPFECPGCGAAFQVSIDSAGELGLELMPGGGLSKGSLADGLFEDPEIRARLFGEES